MDLENFATASRRYTSDIHKSSVVALFMTHLRQWKLLGRVMVECTLSITHCLRVNLQLHTIDLVRTCRISSFCTVAWQLARFQLTRRIARSLGDSWASCFLPTGLDIVFVRAAIFISEFCTERERQLRKQPMPRRFRNDNFWELHVGNFPYDTTEVVVRSLAAVYLDIQFRLELCFTPCRLCYTFLLLLLQQKLYI